MGSFTAIIEIIIILTIALFILDFQILGNEVEGKCIGTIKDFTVSSGGFGHNDRCAVTFFEDNITRDIDCDNIYLETGKQICIKYNKDFLEIIEMEKYIIK